MCLHFLYSHAFRRVWLKTLHNKVNEVVRKCSFFKKSLSRAVQFPETHRLLRIQEAVESVSGNRLPEGVGSDNEHECHHSHCEEILPLEAEGSFANLYLGW